MYIGLEWSEMNNRKYINTKNKMPKQQVESISLFSVPVLKINIGRSFTKDELQLCITDIMMMKTKTMSNHRSKERYLFDNTFAEELKDIKSFCEHQLKNYLEEIEGADTDLAGLRITQSWLNITKPDESHHPHSHANSYLSCVLYIKCLPDDSIIFVNPMHGFYNGMWFQEIKQTEGNSNAVRVNIKKGDLIIFPSWIPHYVNVNNTDKERISLSFNTFPVGELGNYDNTTHLKLG